MILPASSHYSEIYPGKNAKDIAPQTRALAFCMNLTGIEKLFPREDIHEFLCRMALAFRQMYIVEMPASEEFQLTFIRDGKPASISTKDLERSHRIQLAPYRQINLIDMYSGSKNLLEFMSDGKQYFLTAEDIANHIGMHLTKFPNETVQDKWRFETKYAHDYTEAKALFCNRNKLLWVDSEEIRITDDLVTKVQEFADSVLKNIPDESFEQFKNQNPGLVINMERRKKAVGPAKLVFDWDRFSPDIQDTVLKHLFSEYYKEGISLETIQKKNSQSKDIVYLVWLYANDFIWGEESGEIDPRYELEFYDVHGDGIYIKSNMGLYRKYDIGAIMHLLKVAD